MKNITSRLIACAVASVSIMSRLSADVKLPGFFSDNMILRLMANIPLWDRATPGWKVKVKASWSNQTWRTTSNGMAIRNLRRLSGLPIGN